MRTNPIKMQGLQRPQPFQGPHREGSSRLLWARLQGDRASALTEFAIVAPIFVLLIFWSQFFADLGVVRIKVDEAARFAVWETTAQRNPRDIEREVQSRFANLASPERIQRANPVGVRSFPSATFIARVEENLDASFDARISLPPNSGNLLQDALRLALPLINQAVSSVFRQFGLNQNGASRAEIEATVTNTLFPSGRVLNIFFDAGQGSGTFTLRSRTPSLVVDTWKAWPGRYRTANGSSTNVNTDVCDTYPDTRNNQASVVEREVEAQVTRGAFLGNAQVGRTVASVAEVLAALSGPNLISTRTWAERNWRNAGPIAILPADQPRQTLCPSSSGSLPDNQRMGGGREERNGWVRGTAVEYPANTVDGSPFGREKVDRSRFTVPYRVNTGIWLNKGGATNRGEMALMPQNMFNTPNLNPYVRAMDCRDVYYMGSFFPQQTSYDEGHNLRAYRRCF